MRVIDYQHVALLKALPLKDGLFTFGLEKAMKRMLVHVPQS